MIEHDTKAWAIVELMGHRRLAGEVSQSTMFGVPLLRIDIPAVGEIPANTQMYGASAVYDQRGEFERGKESQRVLTVG